MQSFYLMDNGFGIVVVHAGIQFKGCGRDPYPGQIFVDNAFWYDRYCYMYV